jgi:hypothetical protein
MPHQEGRALQVELKQTIRVNVPIQERRQSPESSVCSHAQSPCLPIVQIPGTIFDSEKDCLLDLEYGRRLQEHQLGA